MKALWLPYVVDDPDGAARFFTDHLGLSIVDRFVDGVVLRFTDDAFLELARPGTGAPAPVALELADRPAVDAVYQQWQPAPAAPRTFVRGHYGFDAAAPGAGRIMVWCDR
jgi:catechol 2,3-dioxygenase-like lactoylglutathione lyase family enzyme